MTVSIFNDVIGPVMRGPSSSHRAAALRIGRLARDLMAGDIAEVRVEFDRSESLPTTHESQGPDMGLFGGLQGWDAADERLPGSGEALRAAAMAAAALVTLAGGTLAQSVAAASMGLQNMLGLVCDPVANCVEVPCLGKNVMAASNAFGCANLALAEYDPVIPLDEVVEAARQVSGQMPRELRCTGLGGLAATPTSLDLERSLAARKTGTCGTGCPLCAAA